MDHKRPKADVVFGDAGSLEDDRLGEQINNPDTATLDAPQGLEGTPVVGFDYTKLDEPTRASLKSAAERIRCHMQRTQDQIIAIGQELINAKGALEHGRFGNWIAAEFGMSDQTARRFMHVAKRFGKTNTVLDFTPSILYELAAPSASDEVVQVALDRAAAGEKLTRDDVREIKKELSAIAAHPDARTALRQVAKEVRATEQTARHQERQRELEKIAERNPELPTGRLFSFVLIDVPRHQDAYADDTGSEKAPENHFPTMSFKELCDFSIDSFAAPDAVLAYWSTAASLLDDLDILAEWGFIALRSRYSTGELIRGPDGGPAGRIGGGRYGSYQIWRKQRLGKQTGTGRWFRDQHEMLILCRRGNAPAPLPGTQDQSVFDAPIGEHSEKPHDHVRAWIDRCWPDMEKIEVFARGAAPKGWTFWGNQVSASDCSEHVVAPHPVTAESRSEDVTPPSREVRPPKTVAQLAAIYLAIPHATKRDEDHARRLGERILPVLGHRTLEKCGPLAVWRCKRLRTSRSSLRRDDKVWRDFWDWARAHGHLPVAA
jgi:N6-adenosine-specific RNA methylase IME4